MVSITTIVYSDGITNFADSAGNLIDAGDVQFLSAAGDLSVTSLTIRGGSIELLATGVGNFQTVNAAQFNGDGSGLTGLPVTTLQTALTAGDDAGGLSMQNLNNVQATTFQGDGSSLTNLPPQLLSDILTANNSAGSQPITDIASLTVAGNVASDSLNTNGITCVNLTVDNAGFAVFGAGQATQQTGGAASAGVLWGATEQAMLQAAYDALRTFGFLT